MQLLDRVTVSIATMTSNHHNVHSHKTNLLRKRSNCMLRHGTTLCTIGKLKPHSSNSFLKKVQIPPLVCHYMINGTSTLVCEFHMHCSTETAIDAWNKLCPLCSQQARRISAACWALPLAASNARTAPSRAKPMASRVSSASLCFGSEFPV